MAQSKTMSMIESTTNVVVGYFIAVLANYFVLPMFNYNVTVAHSFQIGLIFMAIAIVRNYIFRRMFNAIKGEREI
tara:strand:- start:9282 stop:9506 length:225 start_codon:yes stop_codon:yes gene_type:complete